MTFDEAMADMAEVAENAVGTIMGDYARGLLKDEDDITGAIVGGLRIAINSRRIGGLKWDASVLTHRRSGEEGIYGGDLLIHTKVISPEVTYSKGVLI